MKHTTKAVFLAALALLAGVSGAVLRLRAQSAGCAWCSTTELSPYEYCDAGWLYKHAFLVAEGDYGGPHHNQFYCGLCSMEHDVCSDDWRWAVAEVRRAASPGGDLQGALQRHRRFARLDAQGRTVVLRDCRGKVTETLTVRERGAEPVGE